MRLRSVFLIVLTVVSVGVILNYAHLQAQVVNRGNTVAQNGRYPSDLGDQWSTYGSKTDNTNLTLAAAPGAGRVVYLYEAYCVNVHASTAGVALIKYSTTTVAAVTCIPANGNVTPTFFNPPLQFPANTAVTINAVTGITTLHFYGAGTVAR